MHAVALTDLFSSELLPRLRVVDGGRRSAPTELRPGTTLGRGRYRIVRYLGHGSMGIVFEAYDRWRRAPVAVKTVLRRAVESEADLRREFTSFAGVHHENVVSLHELFEDAGRWFFTMERVTGPACLAWARPNGHYDEARVRALIPQLFAAIHAIHSAGLLHCDVKPSNVLMTRDGRVRLIDFGLGIGLRCPRIVTDASGTPAYMAPEHGAGWGASDASDWYSAGTLLFETLTGRLPYGDGPGVLIEKQFRDVPSPRRFAPYVPDNLAALCLQLLRRDPRARPSGASLARQWVEGRAVSAS